MVLKAKKIVFTGGGSAGHVMPNIALIEKLIQEDWTISYIGSYHGIERDLINKLGINYYPITTGKLRRYFSWQNFIDPFKVIFGILQALWLIVKLKPRVVFSKGGFVALPVVIAAWVLRVPVIIHEADLTIGLANRLSFPFASKICVTFPETACAIKGSKVIVSGLPIRQSFFQGDPERGRKLCGFNHDKKIMVIFGGSLGADKINRVVREILPVILERFQVAHVCGKGMVDYEINLNGYQQFEYLGEEFSHLLAAADLVITRAGANAIYELMVLGKPSILLPLGRGASRGDQIINAKYCLAKGFSQVIFEYELTADFLLAKIYEAELKNNEMVNKLKKIEILPATAIIAKEIANLIS